MSAEPLTRAEQEARFRDAMREDIPEYASIGSSAFAHSNLRWYATVRAAKERAERLRAEMSLALRDFQRGYDEKAHDRLRSALAADDAARGDQ